jgi:ribosomal protein S4
MRLAGLIQKGEFTMTHALPFAEVLEAADHLSQDEQQELIAILNRRLAQAARQRLAEEVQEARQQFAEGLCLPATPEELMRETMK